MCQIAFWILELKPYPTSGNHGDNVFHHLFLSYFHDFVFTVAHLGNILVGLTSSFNIILLWFLKFWHSDNLFYLLDYISL